VLSPGASSHALCCRGRRDRRARSRPRGGEPLESRPGDDIPTPPRDWPLIAPSTLRSALQESDFSSTVSSTRQVTPDHTDAPSPQQLELWSED